MTQREIDAAVERLQRCGVRSVHSFAWRDLDDPEAGGSEVHADEVLGRWAERGIEVVHHTSTFDDPRRLERRGYIVEQRGGRLGVLVRHPITGVARSRRNADAVVDIWNGVPWWSPLWFRGPQVTWLHHVHGPMWQQSFPRPAAAVGRVVEARLAPAVYRRRGVVTLADSAADEIVAIGFARERVRVIPPGLHARWSPDPSQRAAHPHLVAVGRLAAVKRYVDLLASVAAARVDQPNLTLTIVGDGPERPAVDTWIRQNDAASWVEVRGRLSDDELLVEYRRAWLVVSASIAEGWAMVLTEAAACGTPAVATDVGGHRDSVRDGVSGVLVSDPSQIGPRAVDVMARPELYHSLVAGALARAGELSWDIAAARHADHLAAAAARTPVARR